MNQFLFFIDRLSEWMGKAFAWCILVLAFATTYEVFVRYVLRAPTSWAFDISYIMYGTLFMMAGAYTLSRNAHVRGDFLYRLWPPRVQASVEFVLYFIFFFPGILALIYAGIDYAHESWGFRPYGPDGPIGEISINSPAGVPVFLLKTILPISAFLLLLQGIADVNREGGILSLGFGPPNEERRWLVIGYVGRPHPYTEMGSISIVRKRALNRAVH